ncbi:MAG: hypothetical protein JWM80_4676 [Cyanobacteria bacterium RYN_339]|nr:hypothetical protein [Cyanobacteria bacterium RYN_339]
MKPTTRLLLLLILLLGLLAPEPADAKRRPVRHYTRHHVPIHRRAPARRRVKATPKPAPVAEANPYPLYQGDLYVMVGKAALWSKPASGAQVLAQLPKRTIVTNMGRVAVRIKRGSAYFYKVEAPNGKVGYVAAQQLSPALPDW